MNCNTDASVLQLSVGFGGGGAIRGLEAGGERWGSYGLPWYLPEDSRQIACIAPLTTQLLEVCPSGSGNHTLPFHPPASGASALQPLSFLVSSPSSCHTFVKSPWPSPPQLILVAIWYGRPERALKLWIEHLSQELVHRKLSINVCWIKG